jgi:septal ring factor EnvC (AmiA/AmiB activator)
MGQAGEGRGWGGAGAVTAGCVWLFAAAPLSAEPLPQPLPPPPANLAPKRPFAAPSAEAPDTDIPARRLKLRGIEDILNQSGENQRKLEGDVAQIAAERERLNNALIEATQRLQETEERAADVEHRLKDLSERERTVMDSLAGRRALITEVLTVLQRMGRRPPPALLARPEDILEAIRASIALGAVLPQMRAEIVALQTDLKELVRLRDGIKDERERLAHEMENLKLQRERLAPMIAARQKAQAQAQSALSAEAERARALAQQATSLKDLIGRMEGEIEAAKRAAQAAKEADAAREAAQAALSREQRAKALAAPFKDAARLAPAVSFGELKGKLPIPVAGEILKRFGSANEFGDVEKGLSIGARDNGVVVAPCDGWISFAGPYRTYGHLLIINAGGGYYVVLAGMSRVNVNVGQFVLAGEPVASMGDGAARTAATIAIGATQPILYVEFRKDGTSIDSGPWWAKSDNRKVGG